MEPCTILGNYGIVKMEAVEAAKLGNSMRDCYGKMTVRYSLPQNKMRHPLLPLWCSQQTSALSCLQHGPGTRAGAKPTPALCVADSLIAGVEQPNCVADRPLMQTAVTCGSVPLHGGVLN
jgi:hypothetical protein